MKNILWLPAWYPNQIEHFAGDFIQRHARAASIYARIQVIHVVRDTEGKITGDVHEENFSTGNLSEKIIYYYSRPFRLSFFDKIISFRKYKKIFQGAIRTYLREKGKPDCTHIHIVSKNGILARWLKKEQHIHFVITEHWTIYLPEAKPNFSQLPFWQRVQWHKTVLDADGISAVSSHLSNAMQLLQSKLSICIIPNVVDENLFYPEPRSKEKQVHFIHISSLGYQKNFEAILNAFAVAVREFSEIKLSVFGPFDQALQNLALSLKLQDHVFFHQEVAQPILASFLRQTDALISYSRYETFGCVLIEANASGIPVIVADIPVHHELINEGENGFFVPAQNINALSEKIVWFAKNYHATQKEKIALAAHEKYNFLKVGKMFADFYHLLPQNSGLLSGAAGTGKD
jgi:glycosyltransferase involved in cell wall biosynthesis